MTDVSGRFLSYVFKAGREQGLDLRDLEALLPVPVGALDDGDLYVDWNTYARLMNQLQELLGGPEAMRVFGRSFAGPNFVGRFERILLFVVEPRQLYSLVGRWSGPRTFPSLEARHEKLGDGRFRQEIVIPKGHAASTAHLYACLGFFEGLPRLLDLPNALVDAEIEPRVGRFLITPPPSASWFGRLLRLVELYRGSTAAIEEMRAQHETLARKEAQHNALLESLPDVILRLSSDGNILEGHLPGQQRVAPQVRWTAGSNLRELDLPEALVDALLERLEVACRGGRLGSFEFDLDVKGDLRHLEARVTPCAEAEAVLVLRDMTERQSLQRQLLQAQKMEVVGQLAGGVAHDFNNLLTVIQGCSERVLEHARPGDESHDAARRIREASQRAAQLTQQLLAFGRRQFFRPRPIDLNAAVGGMLELLQRLIGDEISVESRLLAERATVVADPGQIEQVVLNLVVNARDAMPKGGLLTLSTVCRPAPEEGALPWVELRVRDTGTGIDPDVRDRAFEPFFTTKPAGEGTGLGLSTVYGIAQQSGGDITIESTVGRGTVVVVALPTVEEAPEASDEPDLSIEPSPGHETVMLVEDEPRVRDLLQRILAAAGYRVLVANDGVEALEVEASHPGDIHALVTDMGMPRMSGSQLASEMKTRRVGIRTLLISGNALDDPPSPEMRLLEKPFGPIELKRALRDVLDERT